MFSMVSRIIRLRLEHIFFIVLVVAVFMLHNRLGLDYYWHLKAGEYLLENGVLPDKDPFSFTRADEQWILHEWLFEIVLYSLYSIGGHFLVKLFASIVLIASLYVSYCIASAWSKRGVISVILTIVAFTTYIQFAHPRPQLLTYLFVSTYLYVLLGYRYRIYSVNIYWLPVIMVFWVNAHGGYVMGLVMLLMLLVLWSLDNLFDANESDSDSKQKDVRPLLIVTILSFIAALINPYTYHHYIYPFTVLSLSAVDLISEWKSPNFHSILNKIYLISIFSYLFVIIYSKRRKDVAEVALPFSFLAMSFISVRHIPMAILVLLPHFAKGIADFNLKMRNDSVMNNIVMQHITTWRKKINAGPQVGPKEYLFNWIVLLLIVVAVGVRHFGLQERISVYDNKSVPVDAVAFIQRVGISGNIFNSYNNGGYLIYMLYPHSKVFIDGRADLYGDALVADHQKIYYAREGWRAIFDRYPIDYVLCDNEAPIGWHLKQSGDFVQVYKDSTNTILVRDEEKFQGIIEKYATRSIASGND